MSLQIEMEHRGRALIVRLKGELDHHTADSVKRRMEEEMHKGDCHDLILSMKDLSFMDSSGIGVIIGRYKQINSRGGRMIVSNVNPAVYKLFEMTGLFKIVTVAPTEKQALSSLEVVR